MKEKIKKHKCKIGTALLMLLSSGYITVDQITDIPVKIINAINKKPEVSVEYETGFEKVINYENKNFSQDSSKAKIAK